MKRLEQSIQHLKTKDEVHRLIDALSEDGNAVILIVDYDRGVAKNATFGETTTSERANWMIDEFKRHLFNTAPDVGDGEDVCQS